MTAFLPRHYTHLPGWEAIRNMGGQEQVPELRSLEKEWLKFTDPQKKSIRAILEARGQGDLTLLNHVKEARYRETPVDAETFLMSTDYLGHIGQNIFPVLRDRLIRILDNNKIKEVIFTGSIGWGKTFVTHAGIIYEIYRLLCLKEPQALFNNQPGTPIIIAALSVTGKNAKNVLWGQILRSIQDSPYFREHRPPYKEYLWWKDQNLRFEHGSSSENSIIGENVISGVLDEANFLISARQTKRSKMAGEFDQAKVLYDSLDRRRTSRFLLADGTCFAKFWLLSSKQFPGDFLQTRIEAARGDDAVAILDYPVWVPRYSSTGGKTRYGNKKFYLFIGNAAQRSQILGVGNDVTELDLQDMAVPDTYNIKRISEVDTSNLKLDPSCTIQSVPLIMIKKYLEDLPGSIRDFSGHTILSRNPFMTSKESFWGVHCLESVGDIPRVHPFSSEEPVGVTLNHFTPDKIPTLLIDEMGVEYDERSEDHRRRVLEFQKHPAINPHTYRFIHVDLARNEDGAGIAIGHFGGYKAMEVEDIIGGEPYSFKERRPITIIDAMVRFYAPIDGKIRPADIRKVVRALILAGGYHVEKITYDLYQSFESIDAFEALGYVAEIHSVDRTDRGYTLLRQSYFDGRTSTYFYPPLWQDLSSLQRDDRTKKIDHTGAREDGREGTKDVSDCVAAIHEHIENEYGTIREALPYELGHLDDKPAASYMNDTDFDILEEDEWV